MTVWLRVAQDTMDELGSAARIVWALLRHTARNLPGARSGRG